MYLSCCCRHIGVVDAAFEQVFARRGVFSLMGSGHGYPCAVMGNPPTHPAECSIHLSVINRSIGNRISYVRQLRTATHKSISNERSWHITSNSDILKILSHIILDLNLNDPDFRTYKNLNIKLRNILGNIKNSYLLSLIYSFKKDALNKKFKLIKLIVPQNDHYILNKIFKGKNNQ